MRWKTPCKTVSNPWIVQFYAQDEASFAQYLHTLENYIQPRAQGTDFTNFYLRFFAHHLNAIAKPGGLFEDTVVTRLPWRGQTRRVRMVVYRRVNSPSGQTARRSQTPEQALNIVCGRVVGGLSNAGITTRRMTAADIHDWLLRWFNPKPSLLGTNPQDRERFYALASYPETTPADELELASGTGACFSINRARTCRKDFGTLMTCHTASWSQTACAPRPAPAI